MPNMSPESNITDLKGALVGALNQLQEGAITYGEFINWILVNVPAPTQDPNTDTIYRCLYAGALTAMELERKELGEKTPSWLTEER